MILTHTACSKKLTSEGKIPHDVELEKHPEKSLEGRMWLMGDVSALINVSSSSDRVSECPSGHDGTTARGLASTTHHRKCEKVLTATPPTGRQTRRADHG